MENEVDCKSLSWFERKHYEELKQRFEGEKKNLRSRGVFLGILVTVFICTLVLTGVFGDLPVSIGQAGFFDK